MRKTQGRWHEPPLAPQVFGRHGQACCGLRTKPASRGSKGWRERDYLEWALITRERLFLATIGVAVGTCLSEKTRKPSEGRAHPRDLVCLIASRFVCCVPCAIQSASLFAVPLCDLEVPSAEKRQQTAGSRVCIPRRDTSSESRSAVVLHSRHSFIALRFASRRLQARPVSKGKEPVDLFGGWFPFIQCVVSSVALCCRRIHSSKGSGGIRCFMLCYVC